MSPVKRIAIVVLAACCAVPVALVGSTSQSSATATTSSDVDETQLAQLAVLDEIERWDALQARSRLGSLAIDPASGRVDVAWVGDVPADVRAIADAAPAGVDVVFGAQQQSEDAIVGQMLDAAAALPGDVPLAFDVDGDAVTVGVPTEEAADELAVETVETDAAGVAEIEAAIEAAGGSSVDVTVEAVDEVPETTARRGDVQDLRGGSSYATRLPSGASQWCTSGFQAVSGHFQHIVTAAHCANWTDGLAVLSTGGTRLGTTTGAQQLVRGSSSYDLQLIRLELDIRNRAEFYTSDTDTRTVTDWSRTLPVGTNLCKAGMTSGAACNLRVAGTGVACYTMSTGGAQCVQIVRVDATSGNAVCRGDSGGPVYVAGTARQAVAAGVVSGFRVQTAGASCSPLGYIAPISDLMRVVHGVQLRTTP